MRNTGLPATLWLSTALLLTTATELRSARFPVGPGEIMLGMWMGGVALLVLVRGRVEVTPVLRATFCFWFAAFVLLSTGATVAYLHGVAPPGASHDAMAFAFAACASLLYLARPGAEERTRFTLEVMMGLTICVLSFLFVYGKYVSPDLGPVNLWYSTRFAGLSRNPNQLALLLCPIPFGAAYLYVHARGRLRRAWLLAWIPAALVIGIQTRSDALTVSWLAGAALTGFLVWLSALRRQGSSYLRILVVYGAVPLAVVALLALYGPGLYGVAVSQGSDLYAYNNQGSARLLLYGNGLRAIASSPLVGLGPGAFSGSLGPFGHSEAHNTFIDWGASTGGLGVAAFLSLVGFMALRAWRARAPILLVAIAAALVFSVFHYVMRHPVFWFYLLSLGMLARPARAAAPVRAPVRAPPAAVSTRAAAHRP